ncbi:TPA: hypothetical protein ACKFQQ_005711, partial [Klebsiella variicola]
VHLKIGVSVRHIFKPISYLEIQLLSGVSGGYISFDSREAAIMHILMQNETVKKSVSGDRFNTPEGVDERWY